MKAHNDDLARVKDFIDWMNMNSKVDSKATEGSTTTFNWKNLLTKLSHLVGFKVIKSKIRPSLNAWVNNLKRKH